MNNLSLSLFDGIIWENDTTYIWNNRSYSVPAMLNGTDGEEMSGYNNSPVSCNIYWPDSEHKNGEAVFTIYTVSCFHYLSSCAWCSISVFHRKKAKK